MKMLPLVWGSILLYTYPNGRRRPERPWNHAGMLVTERRTDLDDKDYTEDVKPSGQDKEDNKEDDKYEKVCYMCRRPESKAGSMISMPGGMNLCHDCMQKAFDSVTKGAWIFQVFQHAVYEYEP